MDCSADYVGNIKLLTIVIIAVLAQTIVIPVVTHNVRDNLHNVVRNAQEYCVPVDLNEDSTSEWYRLANNLGIDADNRHIEVYRRFERYIDYMTSGNYSRIRKYDDLDDEGKRLFQSIVDHERQNEEQQEVERARDGIVVNEAVENGNVSNTVMIGVVGSVIGAGVVYGGIKYYISK